MKHLKKILFAGCALAGSVAFAETTAFYAQDGLLAMWDGYENAGRGVHSDSATVWKNLAVSDTTGRYDLTLTANGSWGDRWLDVSGVSAQGSCAAPTYQTIEVFFRMTTASGSILFYSNVKSTTTRSSRWVLFSSSGTKAYFDGSASTKWISQTFDETADLGYAATYNGAAVSNVFASGVSAAEPTTYYSDWNLSSSVMQIGDRVASGKGYPWYGRVYAIRLYDRVLTDAEIAANYAVDVKRFVEGKLDGESFLVNGKPEKAGQPSPSYGSVLNPSGSYTFTMPAGPCDTGVNRYDLAGWRIDYWDGTTESGATRTKTLAYSKPFTFNWLFANPQRGHFGDILHFDDKGDDTTGDGSAAKPFKTLATTLSAAKAGDILVANTNVNEVGTTVTFDKDVALVVNGGTVAPTGSALKFNAEGQTVVVTNGGHLAFKSGSIYAGFYKPNQTLAVTNAHLNVPCIFTVDNAAHNMKMLFHNATMNYEMSDKFGNTFTTANTSTSIGAVSNLYIEVTGDDTYLKFPQQGCNTMNASWSRYLQTGGTVAYFSGFRNGGTNRFDILNSKITNTGFGLRGGMDSSGSFSNAEQSAQLVLAGTRNVIGFTNSYISVAAHNGQGLDISGSTNRLEAFESQINGQFNMSGTGNRAWFRNMRTAPAYGSTTSVLTGKDNAYWHYPNQAGGIGALNTKIHGEGNEIHLMAGTTNKFNNYSFTSPATNCVIVLHDAEMRPNESPFRYGSNSSTASTTAHTNAPGCRIEFRGPNAKLNLCTGWASSNLRTCELGSADGVVTDRNPRFKFILPSEPYASAPIEITYAGGKSCQPIVYTNTIFEIELGDLDVTDRTVTMPLLAKTAGQSYDFDVDAAGLQANAILPTNENIQAWFDWDTTTKTLSLTLKGRGTGKADPTLGETDFVAQTDTGFTLVTDDCRLGGAAESLDVHFVYTVGATERTNTVTLTENGIATNIVTGLPAHSSTVGFFYAVNSDGCSTTTVSRTYYTRPEVPVHTVTGATESKSFGSFAIYTFGGTETAGEVSFPHGAKVDILLVGGGGSGGTGGGGGGGAGGMVYRQAYDLMPGAYAISVGKGGSTVTTSADFTAGLADGGDSTFGELVAKGGGAGGYVPLGSLCYNGRSGGSGGGSSNNYTTRSSGTAGQGCDGGISASGYFGGGGGGAGAPGADGAGVSNGARADGASEGGDGLPCDISGATVWYAGGGAGSAYSNWTATEQMRARGGKGGGGTCGVRGTSFVPEAGTDGLGGGGAGGIWGSSAGSTEGGDGVVIVRVRTKSVTDPEPVAMWRENLSLTASAVTFEWELQQFGAGATSVAGTLEYKAEGARDWVSQPFVAEAARLGVWTNTVSGLQAATAYEARLLVTNDLAVGSVASSFAFTTAVEPGVVYTADKMAGLWEVQTNVSGVTKEIPIGSIFEKTSLEPYYLYCGDNPAYPVPSTIAYVGYMWMTTGKYTFAYAKSGCLFRVAINGTALSVFTSNNSATWTCPADGWYWIDLRVSDASTTNPGLTDAIRYLAPGEKTYRHFKDEGDGRVLRTTLTPAVTLGGVMFEEGTVVAPVVVNCQDVCDVYAVWAETAAGTNRADWTQLGSGPVATTTTPYTNELFNLRVTNIPAAAKYVRFYAVSRTDAALVGWSASVPVAEVPVAGVAPEVAFLAAEPAATSVEIAATVYTPGVGSDTCDLKVIFGLTPDGLLYERTLATGAQAGTATGELTNLLSERLYYAKIVATNDRASSTNELFTFRTLSGGGGSGFDPEMPRLGTTSFDIHLGDTITVEGILEACGSGSSCDLALLVATKEDLTDAIAWPIGAKGANEAFAGTAFTNDVTSAWYVKPGATYYAAVKARNALGKVDVTAPVCCAMPAGSVMAKVISTASAHNGITVSGTLSQQGAGGKTTAYVFYSEYAQNKWRMAAETMELTEPGAFSLTVTTPDMAWNGRFSAGLLLSNVCSTAWWTTAVTNIDTQSYRLDRSNYRWKKSVSDGLWRDAANWISDQPVCMGYPNSTSTHVGFEHGATGTVHVGANEGLYPDFNLTDGFNMTIADLDGVAGTLKPPQYSYLGLTNSVLTFDRTGFSYTHSGTERGFYDAVLRFRNGAVLSSGSSVFRFYGRNSTLIFESGASYSATGAIYLGDEGNVIIIDDATVGGGMMLINANPKTGTIVGYDGEKIVFRGASPKLCLSTSLCSLYTGDTRLVFELPKDGYGEPPIVTNGTKTAKLFTHTSAYYGSVEIEVPRTAPFFLRERIVDQQLIAWATGISTNNVVLPKKRRGTYCYWTYGANGSKTDDGKDPTGLWVHAEGRGGTKIIVR